MKRSSDLSLLLALAFVFTAIVIYLVFLGPCANFFHAHAVERSKEVVARHRGP
jgi:hypothetical protein